MKKLKRKILLLLTLLLLTVSALFQATLIFANEISIDSYKSGVIATGYFEAVNSRGWALTRKAGNNFRIITINDIPAFCIEPEIQRGDGDGYTVSDFTHAQRETFSRIIYHGYDNTD